MSSGALCKPCAQWYEQHTTLQFNLLGRIHLSEHGSLYQEFFALNQHVWLQVVLDPNDLSPRALIARNELTFDESSGLCDAVQWIRKYIFFQQDYFWTHIAVRACAFRSFLHAFQPLAEDFCLLPYWCLCDGETNRRHDPLYTTHRHMIAVCRSEKVFEKAWQSVRSDYDRRRYDRPHGQVKIRDVEHLANVIQYVSGTKSQCNGLTIEARHPSGLTIEARHPSGHQNGHPSGHQNGHPNGHPSGHQNGYLNGHPSGHPNGHPSGHPSSHPSGQHHYYIAQPTPPHTVAALHTLLNSHYLTTFLQNISKNTTLGLKGSERRYDPVRGKRIWHSIVPNMSQKVRDCVLPFPKGFYITDESIAVRNLTVSTLPKYWITDMDDSLIIVRKGCEYQHFQERNRIFNLFDRHLVRVSKIQQQILSAVEAGAESLRAEMTQNFSEEKKRHHEVMQILQQNYHTLQQNYHILQQHYHTLQQDNHTLREENRKLLDAMLSDQQAA